MLIGSSLTKRASQFKSFTICFNALIQSNININYGAYLENRSAQVTYKNGFLCFNNLLFCQVLRRCGGAVTLQCFGGHKLNGDGSSKFRQLMLPLQNLLQPGGVIT